MSNIVKQEYKDGIKINEVQEKIITIRSKNVILDSDVARLYGVETNDVNQAVKRNPNKFPDGYIIELTDSEKKEVATNCGNPKIKFSPALPSAFTEKGLYMLATILKSEKAAQTTIDIVEAFAKIRELSSTVVEMINAPDDAQKQAKVVQKSNEILSDIVTNELKTTGTETTFEFNLLSAIKVKHTIKRELK